MVFCLHRDARDICILNKAHHGVIMSEGIDATGASSSVNVSQGQQLSVAQV